MTVSRRALLGLAAAAAASTAACGRAGRAVTRSTRASTTPAIATPTTAKPAGSSRPAPANGPAVEYAHGPRTRDEVALTFHGAGDPAIARELLAIFAAHGAKVTVLGVGTWVAANPEIARQIVAAGHDLGNHTYRHLDIDRLPVEAARAEIVRCRDALIRAVGSGGRYFRPSQAQTATASVRRLAGAAGYPVSLSYDVDSLDYTDPGAQVVQQRVRAARPGSIVSMHFGHRDTVLAMPHILADLAARGLRPVNSTTLLSS